MLFFILTRCSRGTILTSMDRIMFKKIRLDKGYTQKELAKYLEFRRSHISHMENGHKLIVKRTELAMNNLPKKISHN